MITLQDVMVWLKEKLPSYANWSVGAINKDATETVGIYGRNHGPVQPWTVNGPASYQIKAVSLLVHWGMYATPCEVAANGIYAMLQTCNANETIGGHRCWIEARQMPILIGKDANNIFEAVVDFDIYVREEK